MHARITAYLRAVAPLGRETEQLGPFFATCTPDDDNPYLSYAIPDDDAAPTPASVAALVQWYLDRRRIPRLEYLTSSTPLAEPALVAGGFTAEGRLPLLTCRPADLDTSPDPSGIEFATPVSDDDLFAMLTVQADAYGSPLPSRDEIHRRRSRLEQGAIALIARDTHTGIVVGAGSCSPIVNGLTEVAAIGVSAAYRRRGIAHCLGQQLAATAFSSGAEEAFLMAADDAECRIYERVGFTMISEMLHISA
jgi:ribosomal protein S18 acetylase RimI-like enzyme